MICKFLILPNQLFDMKYIDKKYSIVLWECPHYFIDYLYNKKKIMLHRASMKCYYDTLCNNGYNVKYCEFNDKLDESASYIMYNPLNKLELLKLSILSINITIIDTPNIMLSDELMLEYRNKTDKFFFNAFYMWLKNKLNIIPNIKSQDKLNRKRLTDFTNVMQPYSRITKNQYIEESKTYVQKYFHNNPGNTDNFIFPITHKGAIVWLNHFIKYKLNSFGSYEDFINIKDKHMYHSLLSTLINIGLLNPLDIIKKLPMNRTPINSYEGFVRQLFWREYQYYCYKYFDFTGNYFGNSKKLDDKWYNGSTGILPLDDAIIEAFDSGYLHHIKRLMIIGNYMNISGIYPKDGFRWFMEFSCDSYEWVMYQNVFEMVFFISGGKTMRRPYISSSNYILKMSNYKKDDWCDIWNSTYKKFVSKHKKKLWKFRYYVSL